jgi:Protein of unknown function (DUF4232)
MSSGRRTPVPVPMLRVAARGVVPAAAIALAVAFTAGGAASARVTDTGAAACATSSLVVWLDGSGDATAGSTFYRVGMTNLSGRRCTLTGYPGVSAVDLAGRRLGRPAVRDPHTAVRTITLAPRQSATAVVQIADPGVFPTASCRAVTAAGLRVFPPGQTASRIVPFPFRACRRRGPVFLHVRAVSAGQPAGRA